MKQDINTKETPDYVRTYVRGEILSHETSDFEPVTRDEAKQANTRLFFNRIKYRIRDQV